MNACLHEYWHWKHLHGHLGNSVSLGDIRKLTCDLEIVSGMQKQNSTVLVSASFKSNLWNEISLTTTSPYSIQSGFVNLEKKNGFRNNENIFRIPY